MKLASILAGLQLPCAFASGQVDLRAETAEDSFRLLLDSEAGRRHGLTRINRHGNRGSTRLNPHENRHVHASHGRNLTAGDACGDGACGAGESSPTCPEDCSGLEFETSDIGARGAAGVMFYVRAKRDLQIYSLDVYSGQRKGGQRVQVYTRPGKYSGFELEEDEWEVVYDDDSVDLLGGREPTPLGDFDRSVAVVKFAFQSFFIWTPNDRIRYRVGTSEGALFREDGMLQFFDGVGTTSKFAGPYEEHFHSPRVFRGTIRYDAVSFSANRGGDPLKPGLPATPRSSCLNDQRSVRIKIKTDNYGYETSWLLREEGSSSDSPLAQGPVSGKYESSTLYRGTICADVGFYEFVVEDTFEDGLCCGAGQGSYSVEVRNKDGSWKEAVTGGKFASSKTHVVDVGQTESTMTERDVMYLEEHNKRREEWHARYNKEYVPLKWSEGLKDSWMVYAIKLLDTCQTERPKHDPSNPYGENLARSQGSGGWGHLYSPAKILGRFVEREEGLPWPRSSHLTAAIWRASNYVGCAEAEKSYFVTRQGGKQVKHTCRVQVCRYAKPGNCDMRRYRDPGTGAIDWETPMTMDDSPCKPLCPPEGCYDE